MDITGFGSDIEVKETSLFTESNIIEGIEIFVARKKRS